MTLPTQIFAVMLNMNVIYAVILDPIINKNTPSLVSIIMAVTGFFGAVMIIDPSLIGIGETPVYSKGEVTVFGLIAVVLASMGTLIMSAYYRKFSKK